MTIKARDLFDRLHREDPSFLAERGLSELLSAPPRCRCGEAAELRHCSQPWRLVAVPELRT